MANAMNFSPSQTILPAKASAIARRLNNWKDAQGKVTKPAGSGIPKVPGLTDNKNENAVLENLYKNNAKAYNKTKKGGKYGQQYIKSGNGFVHSDYGSGQAGAAIPYQVGTKQVQRRSDAKANEAAATKQRKAGEKTIIDKVRDAAIARRQGG